MRGDVGGVRIGKKVKIEDLWWVDESGGKRVVIEDGVRIGEEVRLDR